MSVEQITRSKFLAIYLITGLLILGNFSTASFVKRINSNEFEMQINEQGTNFSQRMIVDKENGFTITDVPAHNGRLATTIYKDQTNGLVLEVINATSTATFHRQKTGLAVEEEQAFLDKAADSPKNNMDRVTIDQTTAQHVMLYDIKGPDVDYSCVPDKYKKLIPEGFHISLVHQVRVKNNNVAKGSNESQISLYDPITQRTYNIGDDMDAIIESIFDGILPPCTFEEPHRVKRRYVCRNQYRAIVPRCTGRVLDHECDRCPSNYVGWDCQRLRVGRCQYQFTLACDDTYIGKECLQHFEHDDLSCTPCCRIRGCQEFAFTTHGGGNSVTEYFKTCQYIPQDDICPPAGKGCPMNKIITTFGEKKRQTCTMDLHCDGVMDEGYTANSGVNCFQSAEPKWQQKMCCNSKSAVTNLDRCPTAT